MEGQGRTSNAQNRAKPQCSMAKGLFAHRRFGERTTGERIRRGSVRDNRNRSEGVLGQGSALDGYTLTVTPILRIAATASSSSCCFRLAVHLA